MSIPPAQEPAIELNPLKVKFVRGFWEIYDETMSIADRDYACLETDTIRGCIEVNIIDTVGSDPAYLRSAVMAFELAYSYPDPDTGEMIFTSESVDYYTLATSTVGEARMVICGPLIGINGAAFWHFPLVEGTYTNWLTANVHFLFDIWRVLNWTPGDSVEVFSCVEDNQPILLTVPVPPNPQGGDMIHDTAQLLEGIDPTGDIHFKLWGDEDETELLYEEFVDVDGNGTYETQEYETPEDVPYPEGIHWHWTAHYSGDTNNLEADSGNEPVDINPVAGSPSGADEFAFFEEAEISGDHPGAISPGVARFQASDLGQLWFTRTKDNVNTAIDVEDRTPVGPSFKGHVAIGSDNYLVEIIRDDTGAHVYNIQDPLDDIVRPMKNIMGVCYNWLNGDLYMALTPDQDMANTPHDVDWFTDDTGILAAVVPSPGVLQFRKYGYDGELIQQWVPGIEDGWWQEPVKISLTCDATTVYYSFHKNKIKRYRLTDSTQLTDYETLPGYSGYRYGDLETLRGDDDAKVIVIVMTRSGPGPHRGVAIASARSAWDDKDTVAEKRILPAQNLVLIHGTANKILSLGAYYDRCAGRRFSFVHTSA